MRRSSRARASDLTPDPCTSEEPSITGHSHSHRATREISDEIELSPRARSLLAVVLVLGLWVTIAIGILLAAVCLQTRQESWHYPEAVAGASLPSVGTCVRARWSHELAEQPFNLGSPKQIGEIFFNKLKLPVVK